MNKSLRIKLIKFLQLYLLAAYAEHRFLNVYFFQFPDIFDINKLNLEYLELVVFFKTQYSIFCIIATSLDLRFFFKPSCREDLFEYVYSNCSWQFFSLFSLVVCKEIVFLVDLDLVNALNLSFLLSIEKQIQRSNIEYQCYSLKWTLSLRRDPKYDYIFVDYDYPEFICNRFFYKKRTFEDIKKYKFSFSSLNPFQGIVSGNLTVPYPLIGYCRDLESFFISKSGNENPVFTLPSSNKDKDQSNINFKNGFFFHFLVKQKYYFYTFKLSCLHISFSVILQLFNSSSFDHDTILLRNFLYGLMYDSKYLVCLPNLIFSIFYWNAKEQALYIHWAFSEPQDLFKLSEIRNLIDRREEQIISSMHISMELYANEKLSFNLYTNCEKTLRGIFNQTLGVGLSENSTRLEHDAYTLFEYLDNRVDFGNFLCFPRILIFDEKVKTECMYEAGNVDYVNGTCGNFEIDKEGSELIESRFDYFECYLFPSNLVCLIYKNYTVPLSTEQNQKEQERYEILASRQNMRGLMPLRWER